MKRIDLYGRVHKGLRAAMADTLVVLGRADPDDDCETRDAHARLEELLDLCETHAAIENEFIHRVVESRRPDAYAAFSQEHLEQSHAIEELRELAARRDSALYRRVAAFIAANLAHMEAEEAEGEALLREIFTGDELEAMLHRLHASLQPGQAMQALRWMLPAVTHGDRVEMLQAARNAPRGRFEAAMALARTHLAPRDLAKLGRALGQREEAMVES